MNVIDRITTEDVERVLASLPADHIIGDHSACTHCTIASVAHILIDGNQYTSIVDVACDYDKTDISDGDQGYQVGHDKEIEWLIKRLDGNHSGDGPRRYVTAGEALATLRAIKEELAS